MTEEKFKNSVKRYRKSLQATEAKRRKTIRLSTNIQIVSVETNLPTIFVEDFVEKWRSQVSNKPKDKLATLISELGIDIEEEEETNDPMSLLLAEVPNILSKIQPLKGSLGRRTRFLIDTEIGAVQIYLKKPLDVSIVFNGEKLDFPIPSFGITFFIYFGKPKGICDEVTFLFNVISKIIIIEHCHNFFNFVLTYI